MSEYIIKIEPNHRPHLVECDDLTLEYMQTMVEGPIEVTSLCCDLSCKYPDLRMIVNEEGKLCRLLQRNKVSLGDRAELLTPGRVGIPFDVKELYDENGIPIPSAPHPKMAFFCRLPHIAGEGDIIRSGE